MLLCIVQSAGGATKASQHSSFPCMPWLLYYMQREVLLCRLVLEYDGLLWWYSSSAELLCWCTHVVSVLACRLNLDEGLTVAHALSTESCSCAPDKSYSLPTHATAAAGAKITARQTLCLFTGLPACSRCTICYCCNRTVLHHLMRVTSAENAQPSPAPAV